MHESLKTKTDIKKLVLGALAFTFLCGFKAGDQIELGTSLNGRSEAKFRSQDRNIKFLVPAGSIGKVKDVTTFHNGNSGVQIVLEGPAWARMTESQRTVWIYDWKNRSDDIKYCSDSGCTSSAEGPAVASHAEALITQPGRSEIPAAPSANASANPEIVVTAQRPQPETLSTTTAAPSGPVNCQSAQNSFQCMACNCYNEARGESLEGQIAVGKVVQTRVRSSQYPSSICGVVYQRKQFSWTNSWRTRKTVPSGHRCLQVAQQNLEWDGIWASHFHASYVRPRWARSSSCRQASPYQIGAHRFYNCHGAGARIEQAYSSGGARRGNS